MNENKELLNNIQIGVAGLGFNLPGQAIYNKQLIEAMPTAPWKTKKRLEVIASRLGIDSRHLSRDLIGDVLAPRVGDSNPELAARAILKALKGSSVNNLDYLIGHTTSPHTLLPPNIAHVADYLQYGGIYAEFRQACTGFVNGVIMATGLITSGMANKIAVIGSETGSVYFTMKSVENGNLDQLINYMQMGDGAGAIILTREITGSYLDHQFSGSIGLNRQPGFSLKNGGSSQPWTSLPDHVLTFEHDFTAVRENGIELFKTAYAAALKEALIKSH